MKIFKSMLLGALLITGSAFADGFGFSVGPFDLQFGYDNPGYSRDVYIEKRNFVFDNPICEAISHQAQLGFTVEGKEVVNAKEIKIVTKRVIVEPYAFGVTKEGKPILRGKVVSEKLIREVTVKYGDEKFNEQKSDKSVSGWFQASDKKNIDIQNITDVQILANTHFDAPKDYQGIKDENIKVLCQLPVKSDQ